jgi:hypothetical protein
LHQAPTLFAVIRHFGEERPIGWTVTEMFEQAGVHLIAQQISPWFQLSIAIAVSRQGLHFLLHADELAAVFEPIGINQANHWIIRVRQDFRYERLVFHRATIITPMGKFLTATRSTSKGVLIHPCWRCGLL